MLLDDNKSVREIAETLHERGYRRRTGVPFVEITPTGKRKAHISSLCNAGWVVSVKNRILPKTIRGNWEPIVTTEEFERAQEILARRNTTRMLRRKLFYLLTGLGYHRKQDGNLQRMSGSTSNAGRRGGAHPIIELKVQAKLVFFVPELMPQ